MCEQLAIELQELGEIAGHISPRTLHPTIATTNLIPPDLRTELVKTGAADPPFIIDQFFKALDSDTHYIIVDHWTDIPTTKQLAERAKDQESGRRPRRPEDLGSMLVFQDPGLYARRIKERRAALSRL